MVVAGQPAGITKECLAQTDYAWTLMKRVEGAVMKYLYSPRDSSMDLEKAFATRQHKVESLQFLAFMRMHDHYCQLLKIFLL
jgi:hypothetical protein